MRVGHNLDEGRKIEAAIHRLKGTFTAHLEPARQNQNHKVKTIDGITKLFYFEWPIEGDYAGFMRAQCLPHIGEFLQFSPLETTPINKPSPLISSHSIPEKQWNTSLSYVQGKIKKMNYIFFLYYK